jgi:sulfite reductase alpha subunit-like flavoprotein
VLVKEQTAPPAAGTKQQTTPPAAGTKQQTTPPAAGTKQQATPQKTAATNTTQKTAATDNKSNDQKQASGVEIEGVTYTLPGIKDKVTLDKFLNTGVNYNNPNDIARVLGGSGLNINYNEPGNLAQKTVLALKEALKAHAAFNQTKSHTTFDNLSNFVKGKLNSDALSKLGLDDTKKQNFMTYYTKLLDSRLKGLN